MEPYSVVKYKVLKHGKRYPYVDDSFKINAVNNEVKIYHANTSNTYV